MKNSIFGYVFGYSKADSVVSGSDSIKNKSYEEICNYHRFFLNWRHALFAGYILVTGYIFNKILEIKDNRGWWFFAPIIFGIILAIVSRQIDKRILEIYTGLINAGYELEGNIIGNFHALKIPPKVTTHSQTISFFYLFSIVGYLTILFILILEKFKCFPI